MNTDVSPEQRLIQRATMGWTITEQARIDEIGYDAYLEEQLDFEALDSSAVEDGIARDFPGTLLSAADSIEHYQFIGEALGETQVAALRRAIESPRQLYERMVVFWTDHFNIDGNAGRGWLYKPVDDREVVRRHALGTFPELLHASAKSPAMLNFLTNEANDKEHPNENYARELMELHTLGEDNGYTQDDVREVARAFTGWRIRQLDESGGEPFTFLFDEAQHDTGTKTVLGHEIPGGGGVEDGEAVLDILAAHPNTAAFIARKLTRYMWGYEPQQPMVERVAQAYLATGGDIRAMLRVILRKERMARATDKLKRPFHLFVSSFRVFGATVVDGKFSLIELGRMGHLPFTWRAPNGFPDSAAFWSGGLLNRWNSWSNLFGNPGDFGVLVPLGSLDPLRPGADRNRVRGRLNRLVANGGMRAPTKAALRNFLATGVFKRQLVREAMVMAVSSPEFQLY